MPHFPFPAFSVCPTVRAVIGTNRTRSSASQTDRATRYVGQNKILPTETSFTLNPQQLVVIALEGYS